MKQHQPSAVFSHEWKQYVNFRLCKVIMLIHFMNTAHKYTNAINSDSLLDLNHNFSYCVCIMKKKVTDVNDRRAEV